MIDSVILRQGKVLLDNDKVAIDKNCCCEEPSPSPSPSPGPSPSPSPGCICPIDCVPGLSISLGEGGDPFCGGGVYFDSIPCAGGDVNNTIDVLMSCGNGLWSVTVSVVCAINDGFCVQTYFTVLPCENDNLPPAGNVDLSQALIFSNNNPECNPPPVVTITKP